MGERLEATEEVTLCNSSLPSRFSPLLWSSARQAQSVSSFYSLLECMHLWTGVEPVSFSMYYLFIMYVYSQSHPFPGCYSSLRLLYTSSLSALHLESKVIGPCDSYRFTVACANHPGQSSPLSLARLSHTYAVTKERSSATAIACPIRSSFRLDHPPHLVAWLFGFHVVGPQ